MDAANKYRIISPLVVSLCICASLSLSLKISDYIASYFIIYRQTPCFPLCAPIKWKRRSLFKNHRQV